VEEGVMGTEGRGYCEVLRKCQTKAKSVFFNVSMTEE